MTPTLKEYKEVFLMNLSGSDSIRYSYKRVFDLAIEILGKNFLFYKMTVQDVDNFRSSLETRYSSSTVYRFVKYLRTIELKYWKSYKEDIYNEDAKYFILRDNPFEGAVNSRMMQPNKGHMYLEDHDFEKILSSIKLLEVGDPDQLYDIVMVYRYLGLRKTEAMLLRGSDIKKDHVVVTEPKDGENAHRTVPLFKEVAGILKRRAAIVGDKLIFDYTDHLVWAHFKRAVRLAGLDEKITLHTLRKTFGSSHILNGIQMEIVSKWLGHSSIRTTETWYSVIKETDYQYWLGKVHDKDVECAYNV